MPDQLTADDFSPTPALSDAERDRLVMRVALGLLALGMAMFAALLLASALGPRPHSPQLQRPAAEQPRWHVLRRA